MPDAQNQHKPDVKCRTCTDFKTWTKQQKAFSTKTEDSPEEVKKNKIFFQILLN